MTTSPGPWGPVAEGGRRAPRKRRLLRFTAVVGVAALVAVTATGVLLYQQAEDSLTRVPVDELDELTGPEERPPETASTDARAFLVVGSDSRSDTDDTEEVARGDVEGQRSDAILYVSLSQERDELSVLSLPRDLLVERDGRKQRLGNTFMDGAGALVATVQEEFGLPVHHYAKVTFGGFIDAVDTLGGVELCLEDDLVDRDAGADLEAGCRHRSPEDALAFVRSRQGERADLERIERQQRFIRAALEELTERRLLADVPQLFDLVEDVAGNVVTDDRLSTREMLGLADEVRDVVDDDIPMGTIPAYPEIVNGRDVLLPYGPGARAAIEDLQTHGTIRDTGTREQREQTTVAVWSRHREEGLEIIGSTLLFGGFVDRHAAGPGPDELDVGATTTVFTEQGDTDAADRVAALLGAPVRELPETVEMPAGADAVVAVGRDATEGLELGPWATDPDESLETQRPRSPDADAPESSAP